ncbi:MAG: helix-turn-helix transcriptional regulator [Bacteroidetes bacterium]|nr:helix-turn-helix transcriptional regulator [Bacteroidota bacterium]
MPRFTDIHKILLLTVFLVFLSADNNLLGSTVSTAIVVSNQDKSKFRSFLFQKEQDESKFSQDSLELFKEQAISAARNNDVERASRFLEKYVKYSGENGFVDTAYFARFDDTDEFKALHKKYTLNFGWLNLFYLFSALIGFYIGIMLLLVKKQDKTSMLLISIFVLIHSVFILHLFLFISNLQFRAPHTFFMSSIFSYLYGPLIYFYFKRITLNYKFRRIDILHAIPTALIIVAIIPVFLLPAEEKLRAMFGVGTVDKMPYLIYGFSTKLLSLLIYGFLTLRVYLRTNKSLGLSIEAQKWTRTLVTLTQVYILSYFIYGFIIIKIIPKSEFLYNLQIVAMASMVLYIGYKSYLLPSLFTSGFARPKHKYIKSGLTPSFSSELKTQLKHLMEVEEMYLQNDISLAIISERLGTTRHNTSQVINEHFGLNFFELINKYRIEAAQEILKNDKKKNLNIIDVAYEVGFNNKVTFNKSFRKQLSVTPSQYLSSFL